MTQEIRLLSSIQLEDQTHILAEPIPPQLQRKWSHRDCKWLHNIETSGPQSPYYTCKCNTILP